MTVMQMVMQGRWHHDSTLLQLPNLLPQHLPQLEAQGVTSLALFLHLFRRKAHRLIADLFPGKEDEPLFEILGEVFEAANHFPRVDVRLTTEVEYPEEEEEAGGQEEEEEEEPLPQVTLHIDLFRRSRRYPRIYAPRFGKPKDEGWWVVIGDPARNELVAVKRINAIRGKTSTKLLFDWDDEMYGEGNDQDNPDGYGFRFYLISDCYMGLDQVCATLCATLRARDSATLCARDSATLSPRDSPMTATRTLNPTPDPDRRCLARCPLPPRLSPWRHPQGRHQVARARRANPHGGCGAGAGSYPWVPTPLGTYPPP